MLRIAGGPGVYPNLNIHPSQITERKKTWGGKVGRSRREAVVATYFSRERNNKKNSHVPSRAAIRYELGRR